MQDLPNHVNDYRTLYDSRLLPEYVRKAASRQVSLDCLQGLESELLRGDFTGSLWLPNDSVLQVRHVGGVPQPTYALYDKASPDSYVLSPRAGKIKVSLRDGYEFALEAGEERHSHLVLAGSARFDAPRLIVPTRYVLGGNLELSIVGFNTVRLDRPKNDDLDTAKDVPKEDYQFHVHERKTIQLPKQPVPPNTIFYK